MLSASAWLLVLTLCLGSPSPLTTLSSAAVYYVTPHSPNPNCPSEEPCLTLNEYAQGNQFDGVDKIILLFLNGEHNLTAQNFEIGLKSSLQMAPRDVHTGALIQFVNKTNIRVQNVFEVEISGLSFISQGNDSDNASACLSISEAPGLMMVTGVSVAFCQLSLEGEIRATITELTTYNSHISLLSNQNSHEVTIIHSEFHLSILNVSQTTSSYVFAGGKPVDSHALSIDSSFMNYSLITLKLHSPVVYELMILNSTISSEANVSLDTGINLEVSNSKANEATLNALISNCNISGNSQGIYATINEW